MMAATIVRASMYEFDLDERADAAENRHQSDHGAGIGDGQKEGLRDLPDIVPKGGFVGVRLRGDGRPRQKQGSGPSPVGRAPPTI